jgi:hypothetical protein
MACSQVVRPGGPPCLEAMTVIGRDVLLLGVIAFSCTACAGDSKEPAAVVPNELIGAYQAHVPGENGAPRTIIVIDADGSFWIRPHGRLAFSDGPIKVTDAQITFPPDQPGTCAFTGIYKYSVTQDSLQLRLVKDPCTGRAQVNARTWRVASESESSPDARWRALALFKLGRDAICKKHNDEVAAINAKAEAVGEAISLRQGATVMRRAQRMLRSVETPSPLGRFVAADRKRRTARIRLHEDIAAALDRQDFGAASALGSTLTSTVIAGEAAEDRYGLLHCA